MKQIKRLAKLSKEQYRETIVNPVAFHRLILGNPFPLSPGQELFLECVGKYLETVAICGSKAGKSTLSAECTLWGVYRMLQTADPYKKYGLTSGMKLYAMNIAPKEDIAVNVILNYIKGLAENSWYLAQYIENVKREEVHFTGNIIARAQGSSSRAGRGYAIFSLILDEVCSFMDTRGQHSGSEVFNAYVPRLAPFGSDGRLIAISTPSGRSGIGYELFRTGKPIRVLQLEPTHNQQPFRAVLQYATWELNPLPQYQRDSEFMKKELQRDSWFFEREYGALFADAVSRFLNPDLLLKCVRSFTVPSSDRTNNYVITGDPGFERDNYAVVMGHLAKDGKVVIDIARRFEPPLNIIEIENFYEDLCKRYRVVEIVLDQTRSMATINRLQEKHLPARGVYFRSKTDVKIYQSLLELVNIGGIIFPDYDPLIRELKFLERVVYPDRYRVQASPGSTDDLADAVALLTYILKVEKISSGVAMF